ncbi:hypothetical protein E2C01_013329 [Portunus trituberculatus]|uniref:Uncharacterized protein n=1 Tax=Portunus trituberculatus TaxID=210409 RepID=A0A5B7DGT0_PORTR|nr:hypothetical protein [Portunus trituberculatus]
MCLSIKGVNIVPSYNITSPRLTPSVQGCIFT